MGAISLGNKIEVVRFGWGEDGLNSRESWVGNWARRQAGKKISVVRRGRTQMTAGQVPVKVRNAVDDGRITLERHILTESIVKDSGNQRAFLCRPGFFLNQRGQGQDLMLGEPQLLGLLLQGWTEDFRQTGQHTS